MKKLLLTALLPLLLLVGCGDRARIEQLERDLKAQEKRLKEREQCPECDGHGDLRERIPQAAREMLARDSAENPDRVQIFGPPCRACGGTGKRK